MSELIAAREHANLRHALLGGASAFAMLMVVTGQALADDQNHFTFELGGQYGIESGDSTDWFVPAGGEGGTLGGVGAGCFFGRCNQGHERNATSCSFRMRGSSLWNL